MTSRRCFLSAMAGLAAPSTSLRFSQGACGEFTFDTGLVRGKLRAGGKSSGLTNVVWAPTGEAISGSIGLCAHYRVFTTNRRYGGGAREWPSEGEPLGDGSVKTTWPATSDRPFVLEAHYRWAARDTIDVETTVKASAELTNFESFLSSYFAPAFTNSLVYAKDAAKRLAWIAAEQSQGVWQMFPRDPAALDIIQDGRWAIPPSPVKWAIRPDIAYPLSLRRDPASGLVVLQMAPRGDSFAVSTPHEKEAHYSLYLSQFGRTIKAGETARARARLVFGSHITEQQAVKLYRKYAK